MKDFLSCIAELFICFLVVILFTSFIFCVVQRISFPGELAEFDQVRKSLMDDPYNAYIRQAAVECNAGLASNKTYNSRWWSDIFIVDGWDDVQPIRLLQLNTEK